MHFSERFLFIVYYTIYIEKPRYYKTFIQQENELDAKNTFIKKIKRDFKGITINNIRVVKLNRLKYRGSSLSDKQWESLKKISYPNSRHKLSNIPKNAWFPKQKFRNRNQDGTFKKGNIPWNKNLKINFIKKDSMGLFTKARDSKGRFIHGSQPIMIGAKHENPKAVLK